MDYELRKKLKEKGFPQFPGAKEWRNGKVENRDTTYDVPYEPNVEELIKECGDDFGGLLNGSHLQDKDGLRFVAFKGLLHEKLLSRSGSTPREAVANLWLALHA